MSTAALWDALQLAEASGFHSFASALRVLLAKELAQPAPLSFFCPGRKTPN
jgi:hypothetical protein